VPHCVRDAGRRGCGFALVLVLEGVREGVEEGERAAFVGVGGGLVVSSLLVES